MKKIILFLIIIGFALVGCKDRNQNIVDKGQMNPNAMILLRPASGVQLRSAIAGLTALQVVEYANSIHFQSHYFDNGFNDVAKDMSRQFDDVQKDYETPALKMYGYDVISPDGIYYRDFTNAFSVYIVNVDNTNKVDTLAYIPDSVINNTRPLIEQAYNDENYTEVYRLFNEAFTFMPIE